MVIRKVILVEDDPDDRDLFTEFYADREDISILPTVGNGVELIDFLEAIKDENDLPHLIVLDQNMPKMNGKQTLSYLKSHNRYASIPAIIYSTYTDSNLIMECMRLGAIMVAVKPIDNRGYQKMMDDFIQIL